MGQSSNADVRWGIIGCGDVTEVKSGPAFGKIEGSALVNVMRRDGAKAADYARRHGVPRWTADADTLIGDPDVTAVYVATPPSTHADYAIRALEAGKDVLVEKPMALTLEACDRMAAAARETGQKLCVSYYRRAVPRFERLREIIQGGEIGVPRAIEVRHFRPADEFPAQAWKLDPSVGGGGIFADVHTHTLDWLSYVFGPPVAARGLAKRQAGLYAAEDLVAFLLDFGDLPAVGICAYATDQHDEAVTVHGSAGMVSMGAFRKAPIRLTRGGVTEEIEIADPPHIHQPLIERVVAHFRGLGENPCGPEAGRLGVELVGKIYEGI
ncbi:Gfo/Idh/MocA family protein [Amaricoccus macauensis]|uniref:Gfo/Idh/MocA family protein n=1 Tax=Amaricoccus macauensis TaxID=57001 RepID=UPI003C7DEA48